MKKILTVLGARPQFIKAATVSRTLRAHYAHVLEEIIVHTGQHYDQNMSDIFFQEMQIPTPHYHLGIKATSHGSMTGEMLIKLEDIMMTEKPDIVLVYGDTNSTLAAALTASKLHIPIAHVEAGMRAFNKQIPEEINRILTDHVSTYFFCTTEEPMHNLHREGIKDNIHIVGDVMYDAVLFYKERMTPSEKLLNLPKTFFLATIHRQENTDNKHNLTEIFKALDTLSRTMPVVLPLHPRTKKFLDLHGITVSKDILLLEPVGYFDMLYLLGHASLVLTDSGGLQKESYYFNKPAVIFRDQTEWKALIEHGLAQLTGAHASRIIHAVETLKDMTSFPKNLYGNGKAADSIVKVLASV